MVYPILMFVLCMLLGAPVAADAAAATRKAYVLFDDRPAPMDVEGWNRHSYPIGNGFFGVSVFGGVEEDLWQFAEKSFWVGQTADDTRTRFSSLCELRLLQDHDAAQSSGYRRELDLCGGTARTTYSLDGIRYTRELFASYPDRCFAARLTASEPGRLSFRLQGVHPYLDDTREGKVTVTNSTMVLRGQAHLYPTRFEVRVAVETKGGSIRAAEDSSDALQVDNADEAVVYVTLGTNYRLAPEVFAGNPRGRLAGYELPAAAIADRLVRARERGWDELLARHRDDHRALFDRSRIDLGGTPPPMPMRQLCQDHAAIDASLPYLSELMFQYGRYLLIASSREGALPANLQGAWNMTKQAAWSGGYWCNINIQMNYWPAFATGLDACFQPYVDFFRAAFPEQQRVAGQTLAKWGRPPAPGGWAAGTGNGPYWVSGPGSSSGAGTGPFAIMPMWERYLYGGSREALEDAWPFLLGSSRFLLSVLQEQEDGTLLCDPSWSPENQGKDGRHIQLPGTAYDQQLVYENHRMTLEAAARLGMSDPILAVLREQLPRLSPVLIGASGQVKEFRQENAYGEFGERQHRHISQIIGLYPGTVITEKPEWMAAAGVTLDQRGDRSVGWAMAHRLLCRARLRDGERCYRLAGNLLKYSTQPNLSDWHYQVDGRMGLTAGIAEMLLQSHAGHIDLLPALPEAWGTGSFDSLWARGAFCVAAEWVNGAPTQVTLHSARGNRCRLRADGVSAWHVSRLDGDAVSAAFDEESGVLEFETRTGGTYRLMPMTSRGEGVSGQ